VGSKKERHYQKSNGDAILQSCTNDLLRTTPLFSKSQEGYPFRVEYLCAIDQIAQRSSVGLR
jgi:hypothetical protein